MKNHEIATHTLHHVSNPGAPWQAACVGCREHARVAGQGAAGRGAPAVQQGARQLPPTPTTNAVQAQTCSRLWA